MAKRVEFDRKVHTFGQIRHSEAGSNLSQSWSAETASTSTGSYSSEHYQQQRNYQSSSSSSLLRGHSSESCLSLNNNPQIENYQSDDDDFDIDNEHYPLYLNQHGGYLSHFPSSSATSSNNVTNLADHHNYNPTTLYRSGSISIVNCEYKLKEKYPHLIYLIFFVTIYILLIMLGASLFVLFEAKAELRLRDQVLHSQQLFLEKNDCLDGKFLLNVCHFSNLILFCILAKDLKQFVKSIMAANDKGVNLSKLNDLLELSAVKANETFNEDVNDHPLSTMRPATVKRNRVLTIVKSDLDEEIKEELTGGENSVDETIQITKLSTPIKVPTDMTNWEFLSSLNYVATVVTTIGYGHISPATAEGKMLTLIFGAITIPLTLLFFSIIISTIRDGPVKAIEIWLIKIFSRHCRITLLKIRFLHLLLVTFILFMMLILLPAFIFVQLEPEWTFLDSFYYCFITITTVGLGDYVPAQTVLNENRPFYLIGNNLYDD